MTGWPRALCRSAAGSPAFIAPQNKGVRPKRRTAKNGMRVGHGPVRPKNGIMAAGGGPPVKKLGSLYAVKGERGAVAGQRLKRRPKNICWKG